MDYQRDSIGRIITDARIEKGMKTQEELARKLHVAPVYVCNLEKNRHIPSLLLGVNIAKVLELDLKKFLFLILRTKYPSLSHIFG